MDQWNTIERPETSPHTYSQLIFNRGGQKGTMGKKISSASGVWKIGQSHVNQLS